MTSPANAITWTPKERACIDELMASQKLSERAVIRQALAHYQIICRKAHGTYIPLGSKLPDAKLVQSEQDAEMMAELSANLGVLVNLHTYLTKHAAALPPASLAFLEVRIEKTRAALSKAGA